MKNWTRFACAWLALCLLILALPLEAFALPSDYFTKVDKFIKDARWKEGASYGDNQTPKSYSTSLCHSCYAYTADFVHEVWPCPSGTKDFRPAKVGTKFTNASEITTGDVIKASKGGKDHYYAVLERYSDGKLWTAEGNYNDTAHVSKSRYTVSNPGGSKTFVCGWHMPGESGYLAPGKPTLSVTASNRFNEVAFSWSDTVNTDYFTLRVYDSSDTQIFLRGGIQRNFWRMELAPGDYTAKVAAVRNNGEQYTMSDIVSFTVWWGTAPSAGTLKVQKEGNHKLYNVYSSNASWLGAKSIAASSGGTMACVTSQAEQDVVTAAVAEFGMPCWLGGEAATSGSWKWVTGESFSYTNWATHQPTFGSGGENYIEVRTDGKWEDHDCGSSSSYQSPAVYGYVLEFAPKSVSVTPMEDVFEAGVTPAKGDFMVLVSFADGSLLSTTDFTVSFDGTSAGTHTATVKYGSLTGTARITFKNRQMSQPDFVLPAGLKEIGEQAFAGAKMRVVKCPEGVQSIAAGAFSGCGRLAEIYIPASVRTIASNAFTGCPAGMIIFGKKGSAAESFAAGAGYRFVEK